MIVCINILHENEISFVTCLSRGTIWSTVRYYIATSLSCRNNADIWNRLECLGFQIKMQFDFFGFLFWVMIHWQYFYCVYKWKTVEEEKAFAIKQIFKFFLPIDYFNVLINSCFSILHISELKDFLNNW